MTNLLLKLAIGDTAAPEQPGTRRKIGMLSGAVGIGCNLLLFAGKLAIALVSGSVSIMADALNNLTDASGSIVTLVGFRLADKPADAHHPYGHARFEYLSALAVAAMILFIGFELGKSSVAKILRPETPDFSIAVLAVLVLSVGVKFWMFLFNRRLGRLIRSAALEAAAMDSRNDCLTTAAVLLAALVQRFWGLPADGWMGLGVAVFILVGGWKQARSTASTLLGESADPELRQKIAEQIAACPQVLGWHDLMLHDYGPGSRFASIHVEMDRSLDPLTCHALIDAMERQCLSDHNVHLVIHYDPVVTDDPELERLRRLVESILRVRDPRLTIHDFRLGSGEVQLLTFDVTVPAELRGQEEALTASLEQALNSLGSGSYRTAITFDVGE